MNTNTSEKHNPEMFTDCNKSQIKCRKNQWGDPQCISTCGPQYLCDRFKEICEHEDVKENREDNQIYNDDEFCRFFLEFQNRYYQHLRAKHIRENEHRFLHPGLDAKYGIELEFFSSSNSFVIGKRVNNCILSLNHQWWRQNFDMLDNNAFNNKIQLSNEIYTRHYARNDENVDEEKGVEEPDEDELNQYDLRYRHITDNITQPVPAANGQYNDLMVTHMHEWSNFFIEITMEHGSKTHPGSARCENRATGGLSSFKIEHDPSVWYHAGNPENLRAAGIEQQFGYGLGGVIAWSNRTWPIYRNPLLFPQLVNQRSGVKSPQTFEMVNIGDRRHRNYHNFHRFSYSGTDLRDNMGVWRPRYLRNHPDPNAINRTSANLINNPGTIAAIPKTEEETIWLGILVESQIENNPLYTTPGAPNRPPEGIWNLNELVTPILRNRYINYPFMLENPIRVTNNIITPIPRFGNIPLGIAMLDNILCHLKAHKTVLFTQRVGLHIHLSYPEIDMRQNQDYPGDVLPLDPHGGCWEGEVDANGIGICCWDPANLARWTLNNQTYYAIGFLKLWYLFEPLMMSFFPEYRSCNTWAQSIQSVFTWGEISGGLTPQEIFLTMITGNLRCHGRCFAGHARYLAINFQNLKQNNNSGTIEIRCGHGTFNSKFLQALINIYHNLFEFSKMIIDNSIRAGETYIQSIERIDLLLTNIKPYDETVPYYCDQTTAEYNLRTKNDWIIAPDNVIPGNLANYTLDELDIRHGQPLGGFFRCTQTRDLRTKYICNLLKVFFSFNWMY